MTLEQSTLPVTAQEQPATVTSYKGFDRNLQCLGFQFEIGQTYSVNGEIKACSNGFHACPDNYHPLSVFEYYPPAGARFAIVEQAGKQDRDGSKLASSSITITAEISLGELTERAVKWVFDRANWSDGPVATADNEGVTASGYQGAATASGEYCSAFASGTGGKVSGVEGSALHLDERINNYGAPYHGKIIHAWAGIVGRDGIKPGTWYTLKNGKPVEVEQ